MDKIGIFFGTDTGTTRLMAKKMAKQLGDIAAKPLNINRISVEEFMQYDAMILGTPSYGEGDLPGVATGVKNGSWQEFLPQLAGLDFSAKCIALYGLGNQDKYPDRFASSLYALYDTFSGLGAHIVGAWPTDGYTFENSAAVVDNQFVGLVIDNNHQAMLSDYRLETWLRQVKPALLEKLPTLQAAG